MKKFKLGFIVGRFQFFHEGHKSLVDYGLENCEKFVILVGSCDKSRTKDNPFTFEERKEMIQTIYGDKVIVLPVLDLGIGYVPQWGDYLINTIKFNVGEEPDFYIGGSEVGRDNWIVYHDITQILVSRKIIPCSATDMRENLAKANLEDPNAFKYLPYSYEQLKKWQKILWECGIKWNPF